MPEQTEGKSLLPLFEDPSQDWTTPVYSRYQRGNSVITEDLVYSEYMKSLKDWTTVANMLYDHRTDPDENINVSDQAEYAADIDSLSRMIRKIHLGK